MPHLAEEPLVVVSGSGRTRPSGMSPTTRPAGRAQTFKLPNPGVKSARSRSWRPEVLRLLQTGNTHG